MPFITETRTVTVEIQPLTPEAKAMLSSIEGTFGDCCAWSNDEDRDLAMDTLNKLIRAQTVYVTTD